MGTIASVLQWTCTNCNLINPTECLKCLNCGNIRRIHDDGTYAHDGDDKQRICSENIASRSSSTILSTTIDTKQPFSQSPAAAEDRRNDHDANCNGKQMSNGQWILRDEPNAAAATTTTLTRTANANNRILHKTLPGYVEINSNGYQFYISCILWFSFIFGFSVEHRARFVQLYDWWLQCMDMLWCANAHNATPAHIPPQIHFLFIAFVHFSWLRFVGGVTFARDRLFPCKCLQFHLLFLRVRWPPIHQNGQNKSIRPFLLFFFVLLVNNSHTVRHFFVIPQFVSFKV